MADEARSRLGRGLAALIGDVGDEAAVGRARRAQPAPRADRIPAPQSAQSAPHVRRRRARRACASIRERGIIQPIVVRTLRGATTDTRSSPASGAGARRSAPACTTCRSSCSRSSDARRSSSRSSRTCSAPISMRWKRRAAIRRWPTSSITARTTSRKIVGKSRSHVANTLRLLEAARGGEGLHQRRQAVRRPRARADRSGRSGSAGARDRRAGLNVRQVEAIARRSRPRPGAQENPHRTGARSRTPTRWRWKSALSDALGLVVAIEHRGKGGGMLQIRYRTLEQLDDVMRRLEAGPKIAGRRSVRGRTQRAGRASGGRKRSDKSRLPLVPSAEFGQAGALMSYSVVTGCCLSTDGDLRRQAHPCRGGPVGIGHSSSRSSSASAASWGFSHSSTRCAISALKPG